jgi:hypothetical protein
MLDSGLARLLDDMLNDRAIDDGQHLLGDRFGCRKKACAETSDGKNSFAYAFRHPSPKTMCRAFFDWRQNVCAIIGKRVRVYSTRLTL